MQLPPVTIVMPAYNTAKYIGEAIESILNQTFRDFEFLIIDDCSTDNTLEIARHFTDKRIRVIRNSRNLGLPACENIGLHEVKGKYYARMDSDDISSPDRIEKLFHYLEAHPQTDVCGSALKLFGDKEVIASYLQDHEQIAAELIWTCSMPHAACMMRMEKIRLHDLSYDESYSVGEDWIFLMKAKDHLRFSNLKDVLYLYRRGPQSMVSQASAEIWKHNSRVYRALFSDMGLDCSDEELKLHAFLLGKFDILGPSAEVIKQARAWIVKLVAANESAKKYGAEAFARQCELRWQQLFYNLVPTGHRNVMTYFNVSGKTAPSQFSYYAKHSFNKLIGRNT